MNSRERVLRSVKHQEVDRTPCFYLGTGKINNGVAEHLNLNTSNEELILQRLSVDVRFTQPRLISVSGEDRYGFSFGDVHRKIYGEPGAEDSEERYPLEDAETVDDLDSWRWPDPDWFDYELPKALVQSWQDKSVVAYDMGIILLFAMGLRGMEQIMVDMAGDPEMAHAIFARITDYNAERIRRFLETNRGVVDIVGIGDDIAGQTGLFFSVDMWREFFKPQVQRLVDVCRDYDVIPYFHGCGGFRDLYQDFIAMGISCTGRLQTEAKGNDFKEIKDAYGADLCLWGAVDGQHVVIEESEDNVRAHVEELVKTGAKESGFVAGPTHSFTEDTPVDNVLAVYDVLKNATTTCHESGKRGRDA